MRDDNNELLTVRLLETLCEAPLRCVWNNKKKYYSFPLVRAGTGT